MNLSQDDLNEIRAIAKKECDNQLCGHLVWFFIVWFFLSLISCGIDLASL